MKMKRVLVQLWPASEQVKLKVNDDDQEKHKGTVANILKFRVVSEFWKVII
jgi:hypothetical protein